jgi:hypothetical protein
MRFRLPNASLLFMAIIAAPPPVDVPQSAARREQTGIDEALRREGEAVIELANAAMDGRARPLDFSIEWRNDFFKAQPGTFVPFTVTLGPALRATTGALMYVRVAARRDATPDERRRGTAFPYETIFPIAMEGERSRPVRVQRGFAVPPGQYTVYVVVRERSGEGKGRSEQKPKAAVLIQELEVPDFWTGELTTSTVILAERVEPLSAPVSPAQLEEDPYVIGTSRIYPSPSAVYRRGTELIVVFLIYNPRVGSDKHFDIQVDYHLYRKNREGERYVTRTNPQRFNPSMMGPHYDPASSQPVLAGQGILLSEFETGEYRLGITVSDLLSRKSVSRDVAFTVAGS